MTPFSALLDELQPAGDGWTIEPLDDWRQGRTLFGGISAALCLAACRRTIADLPPLRSAQIAYIGPSAGPVMLRPTVLRRGKSVTFMACDMFADGGLATRGLLAFGEARAAARGADERARPVAPPPASCEPLWTGPRPGFTRHFDQRLAGGARPMAGAERGEMLVWARHLHADRASAEAALVAIGDALPPVAMSRFLEPIVISTMSWHIDIVAPSAFDPASFTLLHSVEDAAGEGYSSQNMTMWNENGALIALGRQNVAVFG